MIVRLPKFTWINVINENGALLRQECLQEEMVLYTMDHKCEKTDSEKSENYGTMVSTGEEHGQDALGKLPQAVS